MSLSTGQFYDFSPFRLDPTEGVLLRDGKAVRLDLYLDRERAFAELGLAQEGGTMRP